MNWPPVNGEDPYELIDRFLADESLHPKNPIGALLAEAGDPEEIEFLYARQFNLAFSEDKRFHRLFVWAKDLGEKPVERSSPGLGAGINQREE